MSKVQVLKSKPWLTLVGTTAIAIATVFTPTFEGTEYKAYPDPSTRGAPYTICNGHTRDVHPGDTATPAQCQAWLVEDMQVAAKTVDRCIRAPLNVNQRAALYDTVFNAGAAVVCGSTLQRRANAGDLAGMCHQLSRWKYANGVVMRGLINRRASAVELCLAPVSASGAK